MKKLSKKVWIPLVVVASVIVAFVIIFPIIWCCVIDVDLKASASQIEGTQAINVKWETDKAIDELTITVKHGNDLVSKQVITDNEILNSGSLDVDAYYGKFSVIVKIQRGAYFTSVKKTVALTASEYNFAPLTATMPVTLFSLSLDEVTEEGTIPTFVWFKRSSSWDWSNLPENVYAMPIASNSEIQGNTNQKTIYKKTSAYIKELYELNPNSHFNLYYNDYYAYGWVQATIANGIPSENYNVHLLSDGTASFSYFNEHFDNENAEQEYASMKANWEKLKTQVAKKGKYTESTSGLAISANKLREYAYVMAKEESNVEWWLTRINGTLANNNADFYEQVTQTESVKVKDLNTLLNSLNEEQKENLKVLYKFNDAMFEDAENAGKKVMVILGTWTQNEYNFDDYVSAIKTFYGDEYVYYYKGHPKNPTNTEPGKLSKLENLGLIDIDSTIPAELIMFFNPDIFLSGYSTTTFVSATEDKCCGLLHTSKENADESYKDNMEFFITKVSSTDSVYGSLVSNNSSYLMEFNDTTVYDIAIFNASNATIRYYKFNNETDQYDVVEL